MNLTVACKNTAKHTMLSNISYFGTNMSRYMAPTVYGVDFIAHSKAHAH